MREHTAVCVVYCEGFTVGRILMSLSLVCNASLLANGIEVPVHPLLSGLVHSGWWVVYAFWCVVLSYPPLGMVSLSKETTGLSLVMVIKQFLLREGRRPACNRPDGYSPNISVEMPTQKPSPNTSHHFRKQIPRGRWSNVNGGYSIVNGCVNNRDTKVCSQCATR